MDTGLVLGVAFAVLLLAAVIVWWVLSRRMQGAAWKELARDVGAEYVPGGLFRSSKVVARLRGSTLTLDTYSVPSGDSSTTYTRIRAPLEIRDGFQFTVFREGLVGKIDKALGMQDLEIGIPEFDDAFVVRANDETRVRALLSNTKVRQLIQAQRSLRLSIDKTNELHFEQQGVIRDSERLKSLFALFDAALEQLEP